MNKFEAKLVKFLCDEYFEGDAGRLAKNSRFSKQQIDGWLAGDRKPRLATLRWLLSTTVAPEFRVAKEFEPVNLLSAKVISKELSRVLDGHARSNGVYSFYDSMCNVIYVGKASSGFLKEMYQQLRAPLGVDFPRAIRKAPQRRWQVVRYVSAYEIPTVDHTDYPKHVEALVLRISKPVSNRVLGGLTFSIKPKDPNKIR